MERESPAYFEQQHRRLDAQLQSHLIDVIAGDFVSALARLQRWSRALMRHIDIENTRLLPHLPDSARWPEKLYRLEHERIILLAQEYLLKVEAAAAKPPRARAGTLRMSLALLDAAHALRHVLEHHHEREHRALALELPLEIQAAAWRLSESRSGSARRSQSRARP